MRKYQNMETQKLHDKTHGAPKMKEAPSMEEAPEHNMEHEDANAVVSEHGPAHEINMKHEESTHSVHSKHEDGHEHHSEHESAEKAHSHAKKLAGVPDEGEEEAEAESMAPAGGSQSSFPTMGM